MFTPIDPKARVDAREKDVQKFWEENDVFMKSVNGEDGESRKNREAYTFYDGPPFATGTPHYGHLVGGTIKDVVPRYWTMRGKRVERRWGWDCHGLPIENIVEKEMGSQSKKDIEALGVDVFNEKCRTKVLEYAGEWEKIVPRMGRWVDMSHPYRTMDRDYMESVWWVFKRLHDKGLIYKSYRSMHVCPRCETTLSQSEVSEGYKDVKDLSVVAKFKVKQEVNGVAQKIAGEEVGDNTYILAWTTTPWTLLGNVALAVGEDVPYVMVEIGAPGARERVIVAQAYFENHEALFDAKCEVKDGDCDAPVGAPAVVATLTGADLVSLSYTPLYSAYAQSKTLEHRDNGWKVVAAEFVTTEDGTGVVHIAPAFGEDDMNLGKEKDLPFVQHVGMDGVIKDEVGAPLAGLHVKPKDNVQATDIEVIKDLAGRGLLFHKEKYEHSYPHCWRCDTPLINYATSSWFVAVTQVKSQLLKNAEAINWSPAHIKEGRFGKWLEGARDWSISRQRFWASVMPIWECDGCSARTVFGSAAELEVVSGQKVDDLHKHVVDKVTFACEKCSGTMTRIPDVLDTWFDSGSMPYAQEHYPFAHDGIFAHGYPADFIAEGVDQTRAWFYYLHVLAGALEVGGADADQSTHAFKNVIVNGTVLAEDGMKMSKKLQNYPDPMEMVEKYGADALRLYLMSSPVVAAMDFRFTEKDLGELSRGLFRMLRQSYSFFVMYANVDGWDVSTQSVYAQFCHSRGGGNPEQVQSGEMNNDLDPRLRWDDTKSVLGDDKVNVLDRWIVARLHELIGEVNTHMENYELHKAGRAFVPFVDDLSNWYIRRSRKRFWKAQDDGDKNAAYQTLHYVLVELAKLMAPFTPFGSEEMYRNLMQGVEDAKESVHLEDYPVKDEKLVDKALLVQMAQVRDIISFGLEMRADKGIKVRQPLNALVLTITPELSNDFTEIIKEELNLHEIKFVAIGEVQKLSDDKFAKRQLVIARTALQEDFADFDKLQTITVEIALDIEITPELKLEGQAREVIRYIQQARKKAGFNVDDRIVLGYEGMEDVFGAHGEMIAREVLATEMIGGAVDGAEHEESVKVDKEDLSLWLKRA